MSSIERIGISNSQYCANHPNNSQDSCAGDSGGPLQIMDNYGTAKVVAIVSFGVNCREPIPELPGVYTRVSNYIEWIERNVWPNGIIQKQ